MKNITINQTINLLSTIIMYLIIVSAAIMLGKSLWWLANPLGYDTYDNIVNRTFDSTKLAQTIINRAPFGVVTEEKAPVPTIADQIKVVGVYAAGPNNSVAFITINGKNSIAVIGDNVLDAKVKAIKPDGVVFLAEKQDVTINLSSSSTSPNSPASGSNTNHSQSASGGNGYIPSPPANNNQGSGSQNNGSQQSNNDNNNANQGSQGNDNDSIAEKRRKMIEAFQKQNSGGNDNNNSGQQN